MSDAPEPTYRNPFLVEAMININMIDAIGSGIKKMFIIQKNKFFPLPDYEIKNDKVKVTIEGKVIDPNYAIKLATVKGLTLLDIIAMDKVVKQRKLNDTEIKQLKAKGLIEGRKPNFYIGMSVAKAIDKEGEFIKLQGLDDDFYKKLILKFIDKFGSASRQQIRELLKDKLPDIYNHDQKSNKIKNLIQNMSKKDNTIVNVGSNRYSKWIKT